MSRAPRPQTQSSRSSPDHGSTLQSLASASTVSTCPSMQSRGPSEGPRRRATRFGRPSIADSSRHSNPRASSSSLRNSCAACSFPGGLTVSKRIRRWSSSVVRRSRSARSGTTNEYRFGLMPEHAAGLAYRADGPDDGPPALLVHGYPESSYMWRELLPLLAGAGRRAIAPDLAGFGDSAPDPPGTWEHHVESLERFRQELGLERVLLVVHDWGGLIGLRWACDHPDAVEALVIASTGFFSDGKWHGLADAMRTPGTGEELLEGMTREGFGAVLRDATPGITDDAVDEY